MAESILAILILFAVAGGGVIVIDALIIRQIRRMAAPHGRDSEDRSIGP